MTKQSELSKVTYTSILIAAAIVLELVNKFLFPYLNMPFGGNFIGLSMIPLVLIGFLFGLKFGLLGGLVYGIIELLIAPSGNIVGWSFILDYLVGFTAFGLTGLFIGKLKNAKYVIIGILLAGFVRYLSVSFAGVIFWSEIINTDAFVFSFITYNLGYNLSTTLITIIITLLLKNRLVSVTNNYIQSK